MTEGPYRDDPEAALRRAAELEQEVERLRAELEKATAARGRSLAADAQAREAEESALRIANEDLRRENADLRDRLEKARQRPLKRINVHPAVGAVALLGVIVVQLLIWSAMSGSCAQK